MVALARDLGPSTATSHNPKVTIRIGDAREALSPRESNMTSSRRSPRSVSRRHCQSVHARVLSRCRRALNDDGVSCSGCSLRIDASTLHTFTHAGAVFPQVETGANPGDWSWSRTSSRAPTTSWNCRNGFPRSRTGPAADGWSAGNVTGLLGHHLANDRFTCRLAALPAVTINTDDRNIVEFRLARSLRLNTDIPSAIRTEAQLAGTGRLSLDRETEIDWSAVDTAWVGYAAAGGIDASTVTITGEEQTPPKRADPVYGSRNVRGAFESWQQLSEAARVPRDVTELAMVADLAATTGQEDATLAIEASGLPAGDADVILAALRLEQRRHEDAATALAAAFVRFRVDPWASSPAVARALQLAIAIDGARESLARRLYDALSEPFAVRAFEDARLALRLALTRRLDFPALCRAAVAPFEPHVPTEESFLRVRRDCYQITDDPRVTRADADLRQFLEKAPTPLLLPF